MSCTVNISIHINLIKQHVHSHNYFQKTNKCTHILVYASTSTCWFSVSVHFYNWHSYIVTSSNTHAHPFNYSSQQIGTPIYTHTHTYYMLGCTFVLLIKHTFLSSWRVFFFKKLRWSETFGKLQLPSAIVWTHYEFPLVFHAANTVRQCVVESPPLY